MVNFALFFNHATSKRISLIHIQTCLTPFNPTYFNPTGWSYIKDTGDFLKKIKRLGITP